MNERMLLSDIQASVNAVVDTDRTHPNYSEMSQKVSIITEQFHNWLNDSAGLLVPPLFLSEQETPQWKIIQSLANANYHVTHNSNEVFKDMDEVKYALSEIL